MKLADRLSHSQRIAPFVTRGDEVLYTHSAVEKNMRYAYGVGLTEGIQYITCDDAVVAARDFFLSNYPSLRIDDADDISEWSDETKEFWIRLLIHVKVATNAFLNRDVDEEEK